jgi:hypothetical protein
VVRYLNEVCRCVQQLGKVSVHSVCSNSAYINSRRFVFASRITKSYRETALSVKIFREWQNALKSEVFGKYHFKHVNHLSIASQSSSRLRQWPVPTSSFSSTRDSFIVFHLVLQICTSVVLALFGPCWCRNCMNRSITVPPATVDCNTFPAYFRHPEMTTKCNQRYSQCVCLV